MSEREWRVMELIRWTQSYLEQHGVSSPRLDAELLLADVLGLERIDLYLAFDRPVGEGDRARFRELVRARATERAPVAYLLGRKEFWSKPFRVGREVLIPRPETETLVQAVLDREPERIVEVGIGSGAIAAALALERPSLEIVAVELSRPALAVARENLEALGVAERVTLICGDGVGALRGPFDAVVSNPPYIPSAELEALPPEVQHEPRLALDGGADGLEFLGRLVREAPALLGESGSVALEVGQGQAAKVEEWLRGAGARAVEIRKDLAGAERVVIAVFEGRGPWTDS